MGTVREKKTGQAATRSSIIDENTIGLNEKGIEGIRNKREI